MVQDLVIQNPTHIHLHFLKKNYYATILRKCNHEYTPFKAPQKAPPAATSTIFPRPLVAFKCIGTQTCCSPSTEILIPYSEFPQPNTSPFSLTAKTQSAELATLTIFSPEISPCIKVGLLVES